MQNFSRSHPSQPHANHHRPAQINSRQHRHHPNQNLKNPNRAIIGHPSFFPQKNRINKRQIQIRSHNKNLKRSIVHIKIKTTNYLTVMD